MSRWFLTEKIKVEGLKRKKRRIRLKAKVNNEPVIEKFVAHSSKSAKYAKTTVKKRDLSASADVNNRNKYPDNVSNGIGASASISNSGANSQVKGSESGAAASGVSVSYDPSK